MEARMRNYGAKSVRRERSCKCGPVHKRTIWGSTRGLVLPSRLVFIEETANS